MRLLDRYLFKTFFKTFLAALLIFAICAVALDYLARIGYFTNPAQVEGTFAEGYSRTKIAFLFYVAYLPYLLKQVLPFVAVAAALLTLSHMLRHNEVMPVVAAGVSVRRLFAPLFVCGLVISVLHFGLDEFVLPKLNRKQIALKRFFSGDRRSELESLPHLRDGKGTVTRAGAYSFSDQSLSGGVVVQRPWSEAGFERLTTQRLEPSGDAWVAPAGALVLPAGIRGEPRRLPPGSRVDFGVSPDEVEALASKQGTAEISFGQLRRLVAKFPDRRNLRVAMHKQVARPLTSFVLLLVGIPVLLSAGRARFVGAGLAFALCAGYYFLDIFFTSLGDRGDLPPVLAAYFPLVLLFSIGLARLMTVRT